MIWNDESRRLVFVCLKKTHHESKERICSCWSRVFVLITLEDQQTAKKTLRQREEESQSGFRLLKARAYNLSESQGTSGKPLN